MKLTDITISLSSSSLRTNDLDVYLNDIRKYKPLSVSEEKEIATKAQNGDNRAMQTLIKANLTFVVSVAKRYQGMGLDILDLINEGNIGLAKAAKEFDATLGNKFISFAVFYIRQEILNALCDKSRLVRMPQNEWKAKAPYTAVSVNTPIGGDDDGEKTLLDTFASDNKTNVYDHTQAVEHQVKTLLAKLKQRDKEIVCRLFGIGCNEESEYTISKRYNMTEERVRQIKWEAIEKMRKFL